MLWWTTGAFIGCLVLASACFLYGDKAESRSWLANLAAVTLVGIGAIIFFAGIFGNG